MKRGLSATIEELLLSAEYILAGGNNQVMLCERGIRTFERATRNTLDISAIPVIARILTASCLRVRWFCSSQVRLSTSHTSSVSAGNTRNPFNRPCVRLVYNDATSPSTYETKPLTLSSVAWSS